MRNTAERPDVLGEAWSQLDATSAKADVELRELVELDDLREVAQLYAVVWSRNGDPIMPAELLRALAHAGNYVTGAYANGQLVGALSGFFGRDDRELHLHSHILGVLPEAQGRSVGFILKQHQRAWCLQRGITLVNWTFDPLVARNAYFNMTKLGADAGRYYRNFYGEMNDAINSGEESDRLYVEWRLTSPKAEAASRGDAREPDFTTLESLGSTVVLDEDERGRPVTYPSNGRSVLLSRVPRDIVALRTEAPDAARAWRKAQREALGDAMEEGYRVLGVTKLGWYVLTAEG
jgi:predicted GNAT superfamily acetyltransferase